ncbi:hypothetical protein GGS23DRAFT_577781 [Durotheca rogersii]|uniref:uncharacterized protein n=1 Tax=Durotheca rogersii TaxID=419775 RepID=UPI002220FAC8|nr:uncharacterized protein GGS23DRAFT_577781 [Durotheca rogersii]KAI5861257.1 hypothetical protein GGS23DRAFT_577781 [Durotheca rogersii]
MNRLPETNDGIVTSWIPIPTTHPSQPGCENLIWKYVPNVIAAWDPGYGIEVRKDVTCHPKAMTTWWRQDQLGANKETVMSLGPVTCPQDYYTATASAKDASSTYVACCPINYNFVRFFGPGDTGQCTSQIRNDSIVTYAERESQSGGWKVTSSRATEATTAAAIPVNGWIFASPTGTAASDSSGSCDAAINNALASSNSSCDPGDTAYLSPGAAAGIGVGVALGITGLAALCAGLFLMYKSRRTDRRSVADAHIANFTAGNGKDTGASTHAYAAAAANPRETPRLAKTPEYQPSERDPWDPSTPCLAPASSITRTISPERSDPTLHATTAGQRAEALYATAISHSAGPLYTTGASQGPGEMLDLDAASYLYDRAGRAEAEDTPAPISRGDPHGRTELEGEFDRNVKVSLSTPWLAAARPVPSSSSLASRSHPPP